ncbi:MAG: glycoside hydrolase [Chitinophagaceae bacterium]|nr:MAG: glycoside hydrolase [Chitinophagaceae bacterium]
MRLLIGCLFIFCCANNQAQQTRSSQVTRDNSLSNPVLPNIADAGVLRYNGQYYIGGVRTNGSFYVSSDLLTWKGPHHVFSMNNRWATGTASGDHQIHANDMVYINGRFHLYWSVNHFGNDKDVRHIGHALSDKVLGPYREPDSLTWLDSRIDPKLFVDDDGKLYMYMVKFTDGNTIWGRPMKDPGTFSGDPVYHFASLPNTWETADNRVIEGPWVVKYRETYYMMYNANHTSTQWGNYMLGVAQSKTPLGFNNANKYSYPLLQSNQFDLKDLYTDLLRYDSTDSGLFWYITTKPSDTNWQHSALPSEGWKQGRSGFAAEYTKGSTTRDKKTEWKTPEIWLRRDFNYNKNQHGNLALRLNHSGASQVWLNGRIIYDSTGSRYVALNLDPAETALLRNGRNSIAVYSKAGQRPLIDVALFAMRTDTAQKIVYSPGQPNILKGPNGFEWWLVYMADQTDQRRSQYIDRVHFFDRTMFVDGITGKDVSGYHPLPAAPSFGDIFDGAPANADRYRFLKGKLNVTDGEARQTGSDPIAVLIKDTPAVNYLFEAGVKPGSTRAGIYAWFQDEKNNLLIVLNRNEKKLQIVSSKNAVVKTKSLGLPEDFDFSVYHTVSVTKNYSVFKIEVDGLKLPGADEVSTFFSGKGLPGLFSTAGNTAFDGVIFTKGFDEAGTAIQGWQPVGTSQIVKNGRVGSPVKSSVTARDPGKWMVDSTGISPGIKTGVNIAVKGDFLQDYEFGIQVTSSDTAGAAGIYPVYIDKENYVQARIDFTRGELIITSVDSRMQTKTLHVSLRQATPRYSDIKYTDFAENTYSLGCHTKLEGLRISRHPFNNPDTLIHDLYKKLEITYLSGGNWKPLTGLTKAGSRHAAFDSLSFQPVYADAVRFTNKGADNNRYLYKIWVGETNRLSYNLRARKAGNKIHFFIDGNKMATIDHQFGPSQVGLFTDSNRSVFTGALLYHLQVSL